MEDILGTILDLEVMSRRMHTNLQFWNKPGRSLFPPNMGWYYRAHEFIHECERFQEDLLRPWARKD